MTRAGRGPAGRRRDELLGRAAGDRLPHRGERGDRGAAPDGRRPRCTSGPRTWRPTSTGNPEAWFAADRYGPWLAQLRGMGVRQAVEVRARTAGRSRVRVHHGRVRPQRARAGRVRSRPRRSTAWTSRWPIPATPGLSTSGTCCSPRTGGWSPGWWNDRCWRPSADSSPEHARSAIAVTAEREAWLPGPGGTFRRPARAVRSDDLPPTYTRDEGLAQALGMLQPVVAEAARQLGVPGRRCCGACATALTWSR